MVVSTTAVLAAIGLAIDAGYLQLLKSRMQIAADAAVIGAVQEYRMNGPAGVIAAAKADAARNGFTEGVNGVAITVNNPPATGYSTGNPTAVEVLISQNASTFFLGAIGLTSATVGARAVALAPSSSTCTFVLDPAASGALSITNGVGVTTTCGIVVDSASGTALAASGGAKLTASSIEVVGSYAINNGAAITPEPRIHAIPPPDPLSNVAPPAVGACTQVGISIGQSAVRTISPGVYCGGISVGGGATVTLDSGTYILLGGGLSFGGGASITGSGVTFYNTFDAAHPYAPIRMNNGVSVTLSAPAAGPFAGILIFQDRGVVSADGASFEGGAGLNLTGALYFPTTGVSYSNGVSAPYTILVARTISFSGGVKMNADYSGLPGGSPVKGSAVLSE